MFINVDDFLPFTNFLGQIGPNSYVLISLKPFTLPLHTWFTRPIAIEIVMWRFCITLQVTPFSVELKRPLAVLRTFLTQVVHSNFAVSFIHLVKGKPILCLCNHGHKPDTALSTYNLVPRFLGSLVSRWFPSDQPLAREPVDSGNVIDPPVALPCSALGWPKCISYWRYDHVAFYILKKLNFELHLSRTWYFIDLKCERL